MPTAPPVAEPAASPGAKLVDLRVRQASRALVAGDLASAIATLVIGALVFLAVAALLEHWVTTSGLRRAERWGLWSVGLIGAVAYTLRRIAPLLVRRINPLYAASQIENEAPSLKNSLVNLLQLSGAPKPVRATLEQQAMQRLRDAGDTSLDRSRIVRLGYLLLAIVVGMGLYTVLSPKNLFVSAARIAAPWSDLSAPTRVSIADLAPGDKEVSQGDAVEISARVLGLDAEEPVELVYTTADGRARDARLTMTPDQSGVRYRAKLPAGGSDAAVLGLQSGVAYRIEAGDARTEQFELRVLASPTIAPVAINYDYPDYTGYLDRTVEGGGDIQAIEGTRVTVSASANLPIEAAQIDRGADGVPDVRMQTEGQNATGTWTLQIESDSLRETSNYVIRFSTPDGTANTDPPVYRIETLADLKPEVRIIAPEQEQRVVGLDERVEFRVSASDPDFALSRVRLTGEVQGRSRVDESLFDGRRNNAARGAAGEYAITRTPRELGLRAGEQLAYQFVAADNRTPQPNTAATASQLLVVGAEQDQRPGEGDPNAGADGRPDPNGQQQPGQQPGQPQDSGSEGSSQQPNAGGQQPGADQPPQPGEQSQSESDQEQGQQGSDPSDGLKGPGGDGQNGEGEQGGTPSQGNESGENPENGPDSQNGSPSGGRGDSQSQDSGNESSNGSGESSSQENDAPGQSSGGGQDGSSGNQSGDETGGAEQPVARDGSDDGAAFDRIREHFEQQENGEGASGSSSESGSEGQAGDDQPGEGQPQDGRPQEDGAQRDGGSDQGVNQRDTTEPSPDRNGPAEGDGQGERGEQNDSQTSDGGGETESGRPTDPSAGPREGTGESGENQAADQGTGQSGDQGAGESSGQRGEQQLADEPTGQSSGDERGPGSRSRESEDGQTSGSGDNRPSQGDGASEGERGDPGERGDDGQSPTGESDRGERSDAAERGGEKSDGNRSGESAQRSGDDGQQQGRDGSAAGDADGRPDSDATDQAFGERTESGSPSDRGEQGGSEATDTSRENNLNGAADEPGDAANLDYARRQTELTLEKLSDQLADGEADRELLDKLGWTEDDLRRFVERWRQRRQQAKRSTDGAAELDSALRSLGLRPQGPSGSQNITQDDLRDLRQGPRTPPPPGVLQRLRSYNRGVSSSPTE